MTAATEAAVQAHAAPALDPVTVEVIRRRLVAIADEVDVNITRTAFSPYIYEYKDYAVGIVDHRGYLICQCTAAMPVFVADVMRAAIQDGLDIYGSQDLNEGDIVINNYAGVIGQHLNNMAMYTPIHVPDAPAHVPAKWTPVRRASAASRCGTECPPGRCRWRTSRSNRCRGRRRRSNA